MANNDDRQISIKTLLFTPELIDENGEGQVYGEFDLRNNERTNEYWYTDDNGNKVPITRADLTRCLITKGIFDQSSICYANQNYYGYDIHHGSTNYKEESTEGFNHQVTMTWYPYLWDRNKPICDENMVMDNPNIFGIKIVYRYNEDTDTRILDELVQCIVPMIDIDTLYFPYAPGLYEIVGHTSKFVKIDARNIAKDLFCDIKISKDKDTGKYVFYTNSGKYLEESDDGFKDLENTILIDMDKEILNKKLYDSFNTHDEICNSIIKTFSLMCNDIWLYSTQNIELDIIDSDTYESNVVCPGFINTVAVLAIILSQKGEY